MVENRDEKSTHVVDPLHRRTSASEALVAIFDDPALALCWERRYPADQEVDYEFPL